MSFAKYGPRVLLYVPVMWEMLSRYAITLPMTAGHSSRTQKYLTVLTATAFGTCGTAMEAASLTLNASALVILQSPFWTSKFTRWTHSRAGPTSFGTSSTTTILDPLSATGR